MVAPSVLKNLPLADEMGDTVDCLAVGEFMDVEDGCERQLVIPMHGIG